jgi:hypothetical protein
MGARKIPKEFIKASKEEADARIFHGTKAQLLIRVIKMAPRRILKYFGTRLTRSFEPEITVAEILTQICANIQEAPAKKAAALPPGPCQELIMTIGSHT